MQALLRIEALDAGYGAVRVLHGVSLEVGTAGRVALIGRNGVGKTTLLKAIMGLASVRGGSIQFDGAEISALSPRERAMAGLGYVPQTRDIFPSLTVEENLVAGLKGRPRKFVDEAYALFPRLAERRRNGGNQLSGGEQQMLTVARALLGQPRLLLLDEPLEGLAPIICHELMNAFKALVRDAKVAILLVEQKVDEALRFADEVFVLERGELVYQGTSESLRQRHDLLGRYVGVAGDDHDERSEALKEVP